MTGGTKCLPSRAMSLRGPVVRQRGSRSRRTKNNALMGNGQAVEKNDGHYPHIRWTKIPDFVHVYCGISSINRVFFPTLFGLPRTPHSDCHGLSNRLINTNTSRRSLFFAPKLREPHIALGFEDEVWWSREAQPQMHTWCEEAP